MAATAAATVTSFGPRIDLTNAVNTASYIKDEHLSHDSTSLLLRTAFDIQVPFPFY